MIDHIQLTEDKDNSTLLSCNTFQLSHRTKKQQTKLKNIFHLVINVLAFLHIEENIYTTAALFVFIIPIFTKGIELNIQISRFQPFVEDTRYKTAPCAFLDILLFWFRGSFGWAARFSYKGSLFRFVRSWW